MISPYIPPRDFGPGKWYAFKFDKSNPTIKGILAAPPKATPPKKQGLIKGLLTIGFP